LRSGCPAKDDTQDMSTKTPRVHLYRTPRSRVLVSVASPVAAQDQSRCSAGHDRASGRGQAAFDATKDRVGSQAQGDHARYGDRAPRTCRPCDGAVHRLDGRGQDVRQHYARKAPSTFPLNRVLPGLDGRRPADGVGEKRRFWVPQDLAFKAPAGRPAGTLCFDIELLKIDAAPTAPADVAAPPADAQKTKLGLATKVLQAGTRVRPPGARQPRDRALLRLDYRWEALRHVRHYRAAGHLPAERRDRGWTEACS